MKVTFIKPHEINRSEPRCMCLGYFDGVHLGHQELIKETIKQAKKLNITPTLFTFSKAPYEVLGFFNRGKLTTVEDKVKLVEKLGIEEVIVLEFDKEVASLSKDEFINEIIEPLNVKHLVCGFDFSFGNKGEGNAEYLSKYKDGKIPVSIIPAYSYENEKVSTTRIVNELLAGNIKKANILLGHNYSVEGNVVKGKNIGNKIGFPTANIMFGEYVVPLFGVYVAKIFIEGKTYFGMANIGTKPTLSDKELPLLEVNIFDYSGDLYGKSIRIELIDFIRKEQKFPSIAELQAQIMKDYEKVKELCKNS